MKAAKMVLRGLLFLLGSTGIAGAVVAGAIMRIRHIDETEMRLFVNYWPITAICLASLVLLAIGSSMEG